MVRSINNLSQRKYLFFMMKRSNAYFLKKNFNGLKQNISHCDNNNGDENTFDVGIQQNKNHMKHILQLRWF